VNWLIPVEHREYDRMPASVWIRCLQLLPYLEEQGVRNTVNTPDASADIHVFVRCQDAAAAESARRIQARGEKVVLDLCVNYFDVHPKEGGRIGANAEQKEQVLAMAGCADAVICASAFIAERAGAFHPRVRHIPDSVDARHFSRRKDLADFGRRRLRAVWSGVAVKAMDLAPVVPLLRRHGMDLRVITERNPCRDLARPWWHWRLGRRFAYRPWHHTTFPDVMLDGDLCVAPREANNPYDRGHSHFKVGVFLAQGVPALAGPVPSYDEVLGDGRSGAICRSQREWDERLAAVTADRSLLARWSAAAPQAMAPFLTERVSATYVALFRELAANWRGGETAR
jgi:glycosyltransferase involved in cell wall biosynthesis